MYVTRLSWNSNDWQRPSGKINKCKGTAPVLLYECQAGFGWEEWLFKKEHQLIIPSDNEEFQYGFLQCFNHAVPLKEEIFENVYLTSRKCDGTCNSANQGKYYAIAKIEKLIRLGINQSNNVNTYFEKNGLITNMRDKCLNNEGIEMDKFNKSPGNPNNPKAYINVKFRIKDIALFDKKIPIPSIPKRFKMVGIDLENKTHQALLKSVSH